MKKIILGSLFFSILCYAFCDDLLNELIEKLNRNKIYGISQESKKLIEENKLYLFPILNSGSISIGFNKRNWLDIFIDNNPFIFSFDKYDVVKKGNTYILEGSLSINPKNTTTRIEFIFDKNILNVVVIKDGKEINNSLHYIDTTGDLEERFEVQKKHYLYSLVKDSKENEIELTQDNKLIYQRVEYNYKINPLVTTDMSSFYEDKFVLTFGDYAIPIEIINGTLKIIKEKKLELYGPYYWIDL